MLNHALTVSRQHQIYLQKNVIKKGNFLKLKHPEKLIHWSHAPIARSKVGWRCMTKIKIIIVWFWKESKQLSVPSLCGSQTTINKSAMPCLCIQMWSVWCGLCWLYSPTPFPTHCWTQALSYWKTPAWLSQSGEQRPHWTIHYTEEMSWEIWMLDLRNAFYPGKETQIEHSIRLNKSETI